MKKIVLWKFPCALMIMNAAIAAEDRTIIVGDNVTLSGDAEYRTLTLEAKSQLDMNGHRLRVDVLNDEGSLVNSAATRAALILGGGDSTMDASGASLPEELCLSKEGSGELSVGHKLPKRVSVSSGALRMKGASIAYKFYRFDCDSTYGTAANVMQMSEFCLWESGRKVTAGFTSVTAPDANPGGAGEVVDKVVDGDATTKFVDRNGGAGSGTPCYFILEYAEPRAIDAYSWMTANDKYDLDNYCRAPKNFRLRGSNNGVDWVLIDERVNFVPPATAYTSTELFSFGADATESQIIVASGAVLKVEKGVRLGSVIGTNTLRTLSIGSTDAKYFRLTIRGQSGTPATLAMQFSEFKLYDKNGNAIYQQLQQDPTGTPATALRERSFCKSGRYMIDDGEKNDAVYAFDGDATTKWCPARYDERISPDNPASWMTLTMRLQNSASDVAGYNFCGGNDDESYPERIPNSWLLEASYDGLVWFVADEQKDLTITPGNYAWYNNGVRFPVLVNDGSAVPMASTVEVAPGTTLELLGGQALSNLRVNLAEGGGTLVNFAAAEDGALYLENLPEGESIESLNLPLTLTGAVSVSALRSWSIYLDGVQQENVRVRYRNGVLTTARSGLTLLIR